MIEDIKSPYDVVKHLGACPECGHGEWVGLIKGLCPEIADWQVKMIAKEVERLNKTPTKPRVIPALMEAAGWVRKKEWVGISMNEAKDFYDSKLDRAELINKIDEFLEEKNT